MLVTQFLRMLRQEEHTFKTSLDHRKSVQGLTVTWLNVNISPAKGVTPCWEQAELQTDGDDYCGPGSRC